MEFPVILTIILIFEAMGIASAVHAVGNVRTPQGTIAWTVSLVTMPFISVPAYWIFGRNKFHGYVIKRQADLASMREMVTHANNLLDREVGDDAASVNKITAIERLARLPFVGGNDIELLIDGQATFDSIFSGIDIARDYILVQFYIVKDDELGNELKDRLTAKAKEGVDIYFIYDEVGSLGLPTSYISELEEAGVKMHPFHSRKGSGNRFQLNFRNHRKTVVVDGHTAWIGGHNVGDEYMGRDPAFPNWRDTHIRIEGPAAMGVQIAFCEDWQWAADELLSGLNWVPVASANGSAQAVVIASGPADEVETASLMYTQAINAATSRIWIASPYFVPDDAIVQSLQLAALRGVDVRIMIPEVSDNKLVKLAAYSYFDEVKQVGVRFYRYQKGFLHQKAMLIDDNVATVGTANFDNRSFRLNFEITGVVIDPDFADDVERMFEVDFAESRLMKLDEYEKKSYPFRIAVRLARLTAPIL